MTTPPSTSLSDERLDSLRTWLKPRFGEMELVPASADASFRRYFRLQSDGKSYIVMDAPPGQEDCRAFIDVAGRLAACGLHVPAILDSDPEQGFLLLNDLGTSVYLQVLDEASADRLFGDAIAALARMQAGADDRGLPLYDHALLERELRLFPDWYLRRHLGIELARNEATVLQEMFNILIERALQQPRVFVHRDYMPRNLMVSDPNPGILDFQDAVSGPLSYDVISLFKDAFISWPEERIQGWLAQYRQQAQARGLPLPDPDTFQTDLDWMGLQRHLKVLGIFARIRYRDGKAHYLEDAPRFLDYVMQVASRYGALQPLAKLFQQHILPAQARAASACRH